MKYVKLFEQFQDVHEGIFPSINKINVHIICKKYNIENYTVNPDGTIDVDGNVNIYKKGLDKLPLKFNKVSGYFGCSDNQLTTLEGSPKEVGGNFWCHNNKLTTLEGGPKEVRSNFICSNNQLKTLEGCPEEVRGDFICSNNQLTTLEGCPKEVYNSFYCRGNQLTTLEGSPKVVHGNFDCSYNRLFKFEGSPDYVNGHFVCYGNPTWIIWYLFQDWEKVELLNDYDLLRIEDGKGVLIWYRLVDFLETIKKPQLTEDQIKQTKEFYEIR